MTNFASRHQSRSLPFHFLSLLSTNKASIRHAGCPSSAGHLFEDNVSCFSKPVGQQNAVSYGFPVLRSHDLFILILRVFVPFLFSPAFPLRLILPLHFYRPASLHFQSLTPIMRFSSPCSPFPLIIFFSLYPRHALLPQAVLLSLFLLSLFLLSFTPSSSYDPSHDPCPSQFPLYPFHSVALSLGNGNQAMGQSPLGSATSAA